MAIKFKSPCDGGGVAFPPLRLRGVGIGNRPNPLKECNLHRQTIAKKKTGPSLRPARSVSFAWRSRVIMRVSRNAGGRLFVRGQVRWQPCSGNSLNPFRMSFLRLRTKYVARSERFRAQRGPVACLMIRATCSSRQAEPRRVRSDLRFSAAAIPRIVWPLWRR